MWIDADDVKTAVGLAPADTYDQQWCADVADAVNALAARLRPDLSPANQDFRQGCLELAARMYRARGGTDDTADAIYVYPARYLDANIRLLWGLDRPVIA